MNLGKTKAMVCTPGFIWVQQGEAEYKRQVIGDGVEDHRGIGGNIISRLENGVFAGLIYSWMVLTD